MTGLAVALVAVPVADHALKWLLHRTLGPRSLSLGALGEIRIRRAPIWIRRVGTRLGPAAMWGTWVAAAGALLAAAVALSLPGVSIGLVLGGSLSHALETSRRGAVWDYVALHGWPAFDLADDRVQAMVVDGVLEARALALLAVAEVALGGDDGRGDVDQLVRGDEADHVADARIGFGVAVGRAVRTSIVAVNVIDLFLSMAIWGSSTTVRLAG